jgi:cytochrome c553
MILMTASLLSLAGASLFAADRAAYDKACKGCHGADGKGNPAIAKAMKVELRALGSKEVQAKSDDDLKAAITKGTGKMKAISSLSAAEVTQVVAFVRTLK